MAANPPSKLRVTVDANVLVAGSAWARWAYEVLQHAVKGDYQLVLSAEIVQEARASITKLGKQYAERLEEMLLNCDFEETRAATAGEIASNTLQIRDPKDIHVAVSAVAAKVSCLVTNDKNLTENDLLKQQVQVILPAVFLRDYMGWSSEELEAIRHRTWEEMDSEE
jgi:putative PIN family toxin of toxin-antitoxin system